MLKPDQLLELAVIGLDGIIQIFGLPVYKLFWAFAFGLQFRNRDPVGRRLIGVDDRWIFPILQAFKALPKNRLAALALRVGDR